MRHVREGIALGDLHALAATTYGDLVKAVVDLGTGSMVVGGELHADEEAYLLETGSRQQNLWGINLYPDQFGTDDFVEFDSMINVRPSQENRSRSVEDAQARVSILGVVARLVRADHA